TFHARCLSFARSLGTRTIVNLVSSSYTAKRRVNEVDTHQLPWAAKKRNGYIRNVRSLVSSLLQSSISWRQMDRTQAWVGHTDKCTVTLVATPPNKCFRTQTSRDPHRGASIPMTSKLLNNRSGQHRALHSPDVPYIRIRACRTNERPCRLPSNGMGARDICAIRLTPPP
ncbi:unnamed protein product, partial [Ectocarpus fasciculatus]